jgi:quercetin dioxygenase-like cupin family protein
MTAIEKLGEIVASNNLEALKAASEKVTPFGDMARNGHGCDGLIDLTLAQGTLLLFHVFKNEHLSMCRAFWSKHSVMPSHIHEQRELLGVERGQLLVRINDHADVVTLNQYDTLELAPGNPHTVMATEDTWSWALTMPSTKEFPNAKCG